MKSSVASKLAKYKEELDFSIVGYSNQKDGEWKEKKITAFHSNIKKYIPSIEDGEVEDYAIISNQLYYLGEDELYQNVAVSQGIKIMEDASSTTAYINEVERLGVVSVLETIGKTSFTKQDESGNEVEMGEKLYSKNPDNSRIWNVVTEVEDNKLKRTYGTGWTYIPAGETIEGMGLLKNAYMIDFANKEIVQFDKDIHVKMGVKDAAVATENLIFNADPSVMEAYNNSVKNGTTFDISELGENIRFYGYNNDTGKSDNWENPDLSKAFTASSFEFDGINDYIRIEYDDPENVQEGVKTPKQVLAENGFTFEFYGIVNDGTSYLDNGSTYEDLYTGLFCYWNGNENNQASFRFGLGENGRTVVWNSNLASKAVSDFSSVGADVWNQHYDLENSLYNKEIYITVVLDVNDKYEKEGETYYKQTLYLNGEKTEFDGGYHADQWDYFVKNTLGSLKYFCLGRSSMSGARWHYSEMSCYSLKLYNKALSKEEIETSYKKTIAYHDFLKNGGNSTN